MATLVLGPMLRHVDGTSASVWVETSEACEVTVLTGSQRPLADVRTDARANLVDACHLATLRIPEGGIAFDSRFESSAGTASRACERSRSAACAAYTATNNRTRQQST